MKKAIRGETTEIQNAFLVTHIASGALQGPDDTRYKCRSTFTNLVAILRMPKVPQILLNCALVKGRTETQRSSSLRSSIFTGRPVQVLALKSLNSESHVYDGDLYASP